MSHYVNCPYCGADDGMDVDRGNCSECGMPDAKIDKLEDRIASLEAENERLRKFAAWVAGATDCRIDPIVEMVNDRAGAILIAADKPPTGGEG